jgi:hypothetical protein
MKMTVLGRAKTIQRIQVLQVSEIANMRLSIFSSILLEPAVHSSYGKQSIRQVIDQPSSGAERRADSLSSVIARR